VHQLLVPASGQPVGAPKKQIKTKWRWVGRHFSESRGDFFVTFFVAFMNSLLRNIKKTQEKWCVCGSFVHSVLLEVECAGPLIAGVEGDGNG
jgi:hypothetical protein